jgi:hypothetical protein
MIGGKRRAKILSWLRGAVGDCLGGLKHGDTKSTETHGGLDAGLVSSRQLPDFSVRLCVLRASVLQQLKKRGVVVS